MINTAEKHGLLVQYHTDGHIYAVCATNEHLGQTLDYKDLMGEWDQHYVDSYEEVIRQNPFPTNLLTHPYRCNPSPPLPPPPHPHPTSTP